MHQTYAIEPCIGQSRFRENRRYCNRTYGFESHQHVVCRPLPLASIPLGTEVREIGDKIRTAKCFGRVRSEYELSLGIANAVSTAGTVALMFAFWARERERKTKAREIASSGSDTHP